ncbi:MAG: hypothetical protein ABFD04_12015 [Syntrophomonas sp.]
MEELMKQVKMESIRTFVWIAIAAAVSIGIHYLYPAIIKLFK